jgi:hypothetical protein
LLASLEPFNGLADFDSRNTDLRSNGRFGRIQNAGDFRSRQPFDVAQDQRGTLLVGQTRNCFSEHFLSFTRSEVGVWVEIRHTRPMEFRRKTLPPLSMPSEITTYIDRDTNQPSFDRLGGIESMQFPIFRMPMFERSLTR